MPSIRPPMGFRELHGDTQFSFSDSPSQDFSDDFEAWSEMIKSGGNRFGRSRGGGGAWARRLPVAGERGDGSGTTSPTLWEKKGEAHQVFERWPLSGELNPRSHMLDKYRQEMMELVRDVPESGYELSLRDIVELHGTEKDELVAPLPDGEMVKTNKKKTMLVMMKGVKKYRESVPVVRSESLDTGSTLKMFLPGSFGRRKSFALDGLRAKVTPRPPLATTDGEKISPDREWWKRKARNGSTCSSNSSSSHGRSSLGSTTRSGGGGSSHGRSPTSTASHTFTSYNGSMPRNGSTCSSNSSSSHGRSSLRSTTSSGGGGSSHGRNPTSTASHTFTSYNDSMPRSSKLRSCLPFLMKNHKSRSGSWEI